MIHVHGILGTRFLPTRVEQFGHLEMNSHDISLLQANENSFYLHSSQNDVPQHGIITASVKSSLQMLQIKSSGISCFFSIGGTFTGSVAELFPAANERV